MVLTRLLRQRAPLAIKLYRILFKPLETSRAITQQLLLLTRTSSNPVSFFLLISHSSVLANMLRPRGRNRVLTGKKASKWDIPVAAACKTQTRENKQQDLLACSVIRSQIGEEHARKAQNPADSGQNVSHS